MMAEPLELCPLCGAPLRNGKDGTQYIEFIEEYEQQYHAGIIDLDELKKHITVYYDRPRLCFNQGNNNYTIADAFISKYKDMDAAQALALAFSRGETVLLNPPCFNYFSKFGGSIENPDVIVETIKIKDN
jgi:hypothetical protein